MFLKRTYAIETPAHRMAHPLVLACGRPRSLADMKPLLKHLKNKYGNFDIDFSHVSRLSQPSTAPHAPWWHAALSAHVCWMLIGACNPM